ncbi:REG4 protein, partial [Alectura lathami]|nr:REG4 protein [Alectura lathami]
PATGARYVLYCPEGWSYYRLNCFKYFRQHLTWDEAETHCQSKHSEAHLAWIEDSKEAATLSLDISYYQRRQPVWIGLRYTPKGQDWHWTNGKTYNSSSNLPGNGAQGGDCALLTQSSSFTVWSSADCAQRHHFICKFTP